MSDPPQSTLAAAEKKGIEMTPTLEGRELVTDAYIKVSEVQFNWTKWLDPYQANAVRCLIDFTPLCHPDHPLNAGEELTLYNCYDKDGRQRISFSLKQLEYIVTYIHHMRTAEPGYVEYLAKLNSLNDEDQPTPGTVHQPPPYVEENNPWVPLPDAIVRAEDYVLIEPTGIESPRALKDLLRMQTKLNKNVDRRMNTMQPMTPEEVARRDAMEDNETEGPGLRRGGQKRMKERAREEVQKSNEQERESGTGWGGFPIEQGAEQDEMKTPPTEHVAWPNDTLSDEKHTSSVKPDAAANGELQILNDNSTAKNLDGHPETEDEQDSNFVPDQSSLLAEACNKINEFKPQIHDSPHDTTPSSEETIEAVDPISRYYYDAQQAFVLAALGGLASTIKDKEKSHPQLELAAEGEESTNEETKKEIGRSPFVALSLTNWEEDPDVVLEVGWAAVWFQEKLESEKTEGETHEQMSEYGHYIVQNHIHDKKNGKSKPDDRDAFGFGHSLQIPARDLPKSVKQTIFDLAKRAGGGPIYILLHSSDAGKDEFKKIGWRTNEWITEIRPEGWDFPSYANEKGIGKVFTIDTARLFGAIENDTSVLPAIGRTRKTLEETAKIMFGPGEKEPKKCGNAGNYAAYCLQVFLAMVNGPSLDIVREDFKQSETPFSIEENQETPSSNTTNQQNEPEVSQIPVADPSAAVKVPDRSVNGSEDSNETLVNPTNDNVATAVNDNEEEDSEDEMDIKGVYWTNDEGQLIEML